MNASFDNTSDWNPPAHPGSPYVASIDIVAAVRTDTTVLITGAPESAEALARQIHEAGRWRDGAFLVLDCAESVAAIESAILELIPGTLFLRNVNLLPLTGQSWLADRLQHLPRHSPGLGRRLIASTSEPLFERVTDGTFDDRLYYRLNVLQMVLPPA